MAILWLTHQVSVHFLENFAVISICNISKRDKIGAVANRSSMNTTLEAPRQFKAVVNEWSPNFTKALRCPQTPKEYESLCEFSYSISEKLEEKPNKDLQALLDIVVLLIERYQDENVHFEHADPISVLKTLMEDHGLVQADLKNEIGSQGIVSEVLNGKRRINLKMAKALAKRFNTSVEVFI